MNFWVDLLRAGLAWAVILPSSFGWGALFRRLVRTEDSALRGVLYSALGMGCLSYGIVLLGLFRLLNPIAIWTLLMAPLLIFGILHRAGFREGRDWLKTLSSEFQLRGSLFAKALDFLFLLSFAALLMGTLSPEIGGDALCYQLNLPKVFLAQGSLEPNPYDYNSYFPLLVNNLYLIGLATGGVFAAKLFHFYCGFLLWFAIKRFMILKTKSEALSAFVALGVWLTPTFYNLLSTTYIDGGLSFFTFLAVITLFENFFLAGLFLGFALSTKYLALFSTVGILGVLLVHWCEEKSEGVRRHLLWLTGCLMGSGYWILRNWTATGNPFFPYFGNLFKSQIDRPPTNHALFGMGSGVFDFISIFWNMFFSPDAFGSHATRIGILYFLWYPFVVLGLLFVHRARPYAIYTFLFLSLWFFLGQNDRWLASALPVMAVTAGLGMHGFFEMTSFQLKGVLRRTAWGLGLPILIFYTLGGVYHYRYPALLFVGRWNEEEYLRKMERTFPIANWINQNLSLDASILLETETSQFYFKRRTLRDVFLRLRTRYPEKNQEPSELAAFLRFLGVTHLLLREPIAPSSQRTPTPLSHLAQGPFASLLKEIASENIRDAKYLYRLYQLKI